MSKLKQIRETLEGSSEIEIVKVKEEVDLVKKKVMFSHSIEFYLAPVKPTSIVEDLQRMLNSVTDINPSMVYEFGLWNGKMSFGSLRFIENIGTEITHRTVIVHDEDLFLCEGLSNGELVEDSSKQLLRNITIRLFPNKTIALGVALGKTGNEVFQKEITV